MAMLKNRFVAEETACTTGLKSAAASFRVILYTGFVGVVARTLLTPPAGVVVVVLTSPRAVTDIY